jgi:integrin alpha FG-GAP repeat containing protein 1
VLDTNDDWLADLVLSSDKGFEVWLANNSHEGRYHYNHTMENPVGNGHYGQAIFMDLELNGVLHQLIPYCKNKDCSESTICVISNNHCHDLNVIFVQDNNDTKWGFLTPKSESDYDHQHDFFRRIISMRSGDFNNDGYPDLLATLEKKKGKSEIQTFLLENIANPNPKESDKFKRTFKVQWTALNPFGADTVMGSFYDFYQDGILDVILLLKNGSQYKPLAFRNTLDYDANFVKIIVLTGLNNKKAPSKQAPFGPRKRNYGTNLPGPSIKYKTTTQEGLEQNGISTQLPQSAYFALHLPYTCFGLGRTPNFVDDVKIGLAGHYRGWPQLIPNSQMFVIPIEATQPSTWKAQLFVTPSKLILRSVIALLGKKLFFKIN